MRSTLAQELRLRLVAWTWRTWLKLKEIENVQNTTNTSHEVSKFWKFCQRQCEEWLGLVQRNCPKMIQQSALKGRQWHPLFWWFWWPLIQCFGYDIRGRKQLLWATSVHQHSQIFTVHRPWTLDSWFAALPPTQLGHCPAQTLVGHHLICAECFHWCFQVLGRNIYRTE